MASTCPKCGRLGQEDLLLCEFCGSPFQSIFSYIQKQQTNHYNFTNISMTAVSQEKMKLFIPNSPYRKEFHWTPPYREMWFQYWRYIDDHKAREDWLRKDYLTIWNLLLPHFQEGWLILDKYGHMHNTMFINDWDAYADGYKVRYRYGKRFLLSELAACRSERRHQNIGTLEQ